MNLFKNLIIAATLTLISVLFPTLLSAKETVIKNVIISNSYNHLHIQFQLANSFSKKMEEAIKTGIPTTFTYYINLYQKRPFWNDKLVTAVTLSKTLKYDNLKDEYVVAGEKGKPNGEEDLVLSSLFEAKKIMNKVLLPSYYPMWKLERNKDYYVKIKATSKGVEPPRYLHYLLFFLKWMNFETDWFVEKFKY